MKSLKADKQNVISKRLAASWRDFWSALSTPKVWVALAMHDIKSKYRGSILGPFWVTITLAMAIFGIGILFGDIFDTSAKQFFPLVAIGLGLWVYISANFSESCNAYMEAAAIIKQSPIAYSIQPLRVIFRNLVVFFHHVFVFVAVLYWSGDLFTANYGGFVVGFLLLLANIVWISFFLATMCARYRDIPQIVTAVLMMGVFISPVFWRPGMLEHSQAFVNANPFTHMIQIVRAPLIEGMLPTLSLQYMSAMLGVGIILTCLTFGLMRKRIVFYV